MPFSSMWQNLNSWPKELARSLALSLRKLKNVTSGALTSRTAKKQICHAAATTAQKVASRRDILIVAGVLNQKLTRRAGRHESAKLSSKKRRAKVWKTQCESFKTNALTLSKRCVCVCVLPLWFWNKKWSAHKPFFGSSRQLVKLNDLQRFNFAYNPELVLNMLVFWAVINLLFRLIFVCFVNVFAMLEEPYLRCFDIVFAQKVNLSRRWG